MSLYANLAGAYDALFPLPGAALGFLESLLPQTLERPPRVLDAGCATGSLLRALAARGWEGIGIEPESAMVELARAKAQEAGLDRARFVLGDMLETEALAGPGPFDLVLCLGNSLPHLRPEGARRFLSLAAGLLAPGGALVLQLMNYAHPRVGPGFAFPELSAGGLRFRRRYEAGPGGLLRFVASLEPAGAAGGPVARGVSEGGGEVLLAPLEPAWLARALGEAGFAPPRSFSGWEGGGFEEGRDLYLLAIARREGG